MNPAIVGGHCVACPLKDLLMGQGAEPFGPAQRPEVCCERAPLLPGLGCYNGFVHTPKHSRTCPDFHQFPLSTFFSFRLNFLNDCLCVYALVFNWQSPLNTYADAHDGVNVRYMRVCMEKPVPLSPMLSVMPLGSGISLKESVDITANFWTELSF